MKDIEHNTNSWEQDTIQQLLFTTIKEQRTKRRWGIFFKTLGFGYILVMTVFVFLAALNGLCGGCA